MNDRITIEDELRIPIENRKHVSWQTSISDKRPKLKAQINNFIIEGLLDTCADLTILLQNLDN